MTIHANPLSNPPLRLPASHGARAAGELAAFRAFLQMASAGDARTLVTFVMLVGPRSWLARSVG